MPMPASDQWAAGAAPHPPRLRLRCRYRCLLPLWVRPCLLALLSSAARSTIIIVEVGVVLFVIALVAIIAIVIVWPGQTYPFRCVPWSNEDFERELLLLLSSGCQLLLLLSSGCQLSPRLVLALVAGGRPSHIAARPPALQKWGAKAKASLPKRQKWGSALGQP